MKPSILKLSCALLAAVSLSSCVDTHYAGGASYRPGYVVDSLPSHYGRESYGGVNYYTHNGVYYRPQGSRYVVVERPSYQRGRSDYRRGRSDYQRGRSDYRRHGDHVDVIRTLPGGYRSVTHRGTRYYEARGVYYRPTRGGYTVVRRPW